MSLFCDDGLFCEDATQNQRHKAFKQFLSMLSNSTTDNTLLKTITDELHDIRKVLLETQEKLNETRHKLERQELLKSANETYDLVVISHIYAKLLYVYLSEISRASSKEKVYYKVEKAYSDAHCIHSREIEFQNAQKAFLEYRLHRPKDETPEKSFEAWQASNTWKKYQAPHTKEQQAVFKSNLENFYNFLESENTIESIDTLVAYFTFIKSIDLVNISLDARSIAEKARKAKEANSDALNWYAEVEETFSLIHTTLRKLLGVFLNVQNAFLNAAELELPKGLKG